MNQEPTESGDGVVGRRTILRGAAGAGGIVVLSSAADAPWANGASAAQQKPSSKRVYVLVIDGCRPDEIRPDTTPNLYALRRQGTWFPRARSMPIAETIPNHVMMMTGVRPDRGGVPANSVYDRLEGEVRTCDRASDITFPTVLERLQDRGVTTGTVLSKEYLYGVFGTRATYRWEPRPVVPVSGHAPDVATMNALRQMITAADPHLVFANFGDIDRFGHIDITGGSVRALRRTALASTDAQIGALVRWLKGRPRWADTTVVVLADHSMDWSNGYRYISLTEAFKGNRLLDGTVEIADNGGADLISYTGPAGRRAAALAEARRVALRTPGVLSVHTPDELRLGPRAGDLVVYCRSGYRFSDPQVYSNPIPGNHGHPATHPIPFFLHGPGVRAEVRSEPAATIDVAPTIGSVFGLRPPRGGYDGRSRL